YNTFQNRAAMFYGSDIEDPNERPLQKYYAFDGSMEIKTDATNGETIFIFYLGGDAYTAPVVLKSDGETSEFLYLHRDYLGSILAITDQQGQLVEKRHFDPWGNITHVQDGGPPLTPPEGMGTAGLGLLLDRGYTGHEHLQRVELIHMNGRLYDPLLHRFLAPDNYVQDPYNTQNFNRYGYVFNNPLMYTDPNGEVAWFVPILIGAAVSAASYTVTALTADVPFTIGGLAKATVIGAASGAMTFGIGEATSAITQLGVRISMQAVAHGMTQGVMSGIQGGNFWQGAASGALASIGASAWGSLGGKFAQSGVGQITFGTVSGGAGAALTGGNFWEGAATGFVVSALNHAFHRNDNGYDKNGNKINDKGGDEIDYLYDDDGNIIASTAVELRQSDTSEREFRMYGLKVKPTSGALYDPSWDILGGALPVGKLFSRFKSFVQLSSKIGKSSAGQRVFNFQARFPKSNLNVRLDRGFRAPFKNTKSPYLGKPYNGFNTHINIQKPGSFNYHFTLNPLKWKYYNIP
ncbi:MAG: RHS repeat-associated core domain-containing protein, partial [Bacteroidota bacterium]